MKAVTRREILSRCVAALLGGYVLANLCGLALYHLLPYSHESSREIALLTSFPVYAAAVMWTFAARTPSRAWFGLLASAFACLALISLAIYGAQT